MMIALISKETLDLSGNQFMSFDEDIHSFWTKSLRRLSIARNKLPSIPWSICQLENLSSLDISRNEIESIPPPNFWSIKSLTKLNLSHNMVSANVFLTMCTVDNISCNCDFLKAVVPS